MRPAEFRKKIEHLDQVQLLTGAMSSLNRLLVDKKVVAPEELQRCFLEWMRQQRLAKTKRKNGRGKS